MFILLNLLYDSINLSLQISNTQEQREKIETLVIIIIFAILTGIL